MAQSGNYSNFLEYCENQVRDGNSGASRFLKKGKNSLRLALQEGERKVAGYVREGKQGEADRLVELMKLAEDRGMMDGSFELTYEGTARIYERIRGLAQKQSSRYGQDYLSILERFDPIRDSDLIATGMFCLVPEVRERVSADLGSIYRVVLNSGKKSKKGYALPERHDRNPVSRENFFPSNLRDLLAALPEPESNEDREYQRMLHVLVQKKAERDVFPAFKHGEVQALKTLDGLADREKDENIGAAYKELADKYRKYLEFKVEGVNPNFIDPGTGQRGVLPSLHQKIGIYHLVKEGRFGIWDGGGTGKTAIAVLAQPLIKRRLEQEGKEFRRALVLGPNLSKKAWRKGLVGKDHERYLEEPQSAIIIDGDRKDDDFLEEVKGAEWVVMNYEQQTTLINGSGRLFIDKLIEMGVDYSVFDESHNIKALRDSTLKGKPTHSAAARMLALHSDFFVPMSATPISNGLLDFAVQYHLLNPKALPDPNRFMELIQHSPRVLYTFFHESSVRRTSEDINEDLDWAEKEHLVNLDPVQRTIYEHIVEFRPRSWLQQARKALLDPRLVDPEILQRAEMLGQVSLANSAKYRKLEELITGPQGPIEREEKFVVFSTMFREGVTEKGHAGLERRYNGMGLSKDYGALDLHRTIAEVLVDSIREKYGKEVEIGIIDGTKKVEEREQVVDQLRDGLAGIICTTETGGESLDFTPANWAYFLDEDYVPDTEQQALWRELRKGQRRKVYINHIRAADTLDEDNRDYVDKKRIIAKMAMDGVPPTEEEWGLLGDTEGKKFGDLVRKSVGGKSIDVREAEVVDIDDFEVRKRIRGSGKGRSLSSSIYETTGAQEVARIVGQDPIGCWQDPEFVKLYMKNLPNMSPYPVHTAKICDLIARSNRCEIDFPRSVLSEGSGPSILFQSYRALSQVLEKHGLKMPKITDRDLSQLMLDQGQNTRQVLGCMTGKDSKFRKGQFDLVDSASISLLRNPEEVHSHLLEANRVLKPEGLVELTVKNMRFQDEFYSGMETIGFELLSQRNQGFALEKAASRRIKSALGEHYSESFAAKLGDSYFLLAKKVDNPANADANDFWFETLAPEESISELPSARAEKISRSMDLAAEQIERESKSPGRKGKRKTAQKKRKEKREVRVLPEQVPGLRNGLGDDVRMEV
jgi:hypothetical protein